MGYTHNVNICQFIPPSMISKSSGSWSVVSSANCTQENRMASDTPFELVIPLNLQGSLTGYQGAKIASVDVWYQVATAALTSFNTVEISKQALAVSGSAHSGAVVSCVIDADHDSSAERVTVDEHKMTLTITNPEFIEADEFWFVHLALDPAATSVFTLFGAQVKYTLRQ